MISLVEITKRYKELGPDWNKKSLKNIDLIFLKMQLKNGNANILLKVC